MRSAVPPVMLLLALGTVLSGCRKEPDFDSQYDKTSQEIEARAKKLDGEMAQQMQAMDREMEVRGFATPTPQPSPGRTAPTTTR